MTERSSEHLLLTLVLASVNNEFSANERMAYRLLNVWSYFPDEASRNCYVDNKEAEADGLMFRR